MAANNLSNYMTASNSDAPPMPVRTSITSSTTTYVSQTPDSSSSSETRPVLATHPTREQSFSEGRSNWEAPRENPGPQTRFKNQPVPARADASRSPAVQNDLFGNAPPKSLVSAFMSVLDLSENTIIGCAYRLQNQGIEVTEDALYDECMKYKEHSWPMAQTNYSSHTDFSDFNTQTIHHQDSLQSTQTNQSFNTNTNFSSTSFNSQVTNLSCFQPPFFSVTNSPSRRGRSNTGSRHGHGRSRRAFHVSNRNAQSETGVKQGFSRPTMDSHESLMSDAGYSTMSNSSSSPGLSETTPFSFVKSIRASSSQRPTFLPLSSSAGFPDSGFGREMTSGLDSNSASRSLSMTSSRSYCITPTCTSEAAQLNTYHKEPPIASIPSVSRFGMAGDKRAANSVKDNSVSSSSFASSSSTDFAQFSNTSNWSSKTPSISPLSRSEDNPESGYGGEMVSTLESGMQSLQLSGNIASNDTRRENNGRARDTTADGTREMTRDRELQHALSVLNGGQK